MKKAIQYLLIALCSIFATPTFATLGSAPNTAIVKVETTTPNAVSAKKQKKSERNSLLWRKIFAGIGLVCIVGAFLVPSSMAALGTGLLIGAAVCIVMFLVALRFF